MNEKVALVFPGQGSQSLGMLNVFAQHEDIVNAVCAEASAALDYDMHDLIMNGPDDKLNMTQYTQPALLTAGYIGWQIWQKTKNIVPKFLAGHSLGEYTALVCADALTFTAGVKLVAKRGELMQAAVAPGEGAMAAIIGLELEVVDEICASIVCTNAQQVVQAANLNSPGQIVIAGSTAEVQQAAEIAKTKGAKRAILLPVSVPSHCDLMRPAATQLREYMNTLDWQVPKVKVIHNCDVSSHNTKDAICDALEKQLFMPVRWIETIEFFASEGMQQIYECGPGKVLTGLNKRIAKSVECSTSDQFV